jgi:hypothetical protein
VQVQAHALLARVSSRIGVDHEQGADRSTTRSAASGRTRDVLAKTRILVGRGGRRGVRRLGKALTAVGEAYFYFAEEKKEVDKIKLPRVQGLRASAKTCSSTSTPRWATG